MILYKKVLFSDEKYLVYIEMILSKAAPFLKGVKRKDFFNARGRWKLLSHFKTENRKKATL